MRNILTQTLTVCAAAGVLTFVTGCQTTDNPRSFGAIRAGRDKLPRNGSGSNDSSSLRQQPRLRPR